jgi:hypothetical protein
LDEVKGFCLISVICEAHVVIFCWFCLLCFDVLVVFTALFCFRVEGVCSKTYKLFGSCEFGTYLCLGLE